MRENCRNHAMKNVSLNAIQKYLSTNTKSSSLLIMTAIIPVRDLLSLGLLKNLSKLEKSLKPLREITVSNITFIWANERIRVCKLFYLSTLNISQKVVYNAHKNKNLISGNAFPSRSGKHVKKSISEERKNIVREHINSFPKVESHYRRNQTSKLYLDSSLNLSKMYELYEEKCESIGEIPVKISLYRTIFNTEFNIGFIKPKNDRCDTCEKFRLTNYNDENYKNHLLLRNSIRADRNIDRQNNNQLTICFDLEKVITCPQSFVNNFYYKRKINIYNLTAHESYSKTGYCCIWDESICGRSGNDLASALIAILEKIVNNYSEVKSFVLWSDSCIAQNKNSIMSFALTHFIKTHENIKEIIVKFSAPGHSCVQEVDNIHSMIEKTLNKSEFFSISSLVRLIKNANRKKPYEVMEMRKENFMDYQLCAKIFNYKNIPFTKLFQIRLTHNLFEVEYRLDSEQDFTKVNIRNFERNTRNKNNLRDTVFPTPKINRKLIRVSEEKKKDIKSMID